MRVVLVSKAMLSATAQKKADLLSGHTDVELTVVSPAYWRADDGGKQYIEATARRDWKLIVAPIWLNGHFHVHAYPTLGQIIRSASPDIVHIDEEPYNLATFHAMRAARRAGARALFVTWQNLFRAYPPPFSRMEQYNYRQASYALAANDDAASVLRRKGYQGPIAVFPQFGVDTDMFVPRARATEGPPRVGFVGRLKVDKGVDCLIQAFAPLASRAQLVIVGRGPHEPELRALAESLDIAEQVRFLGSLPSTQVAEMMAGLDVLVLPSRSLPNWTEQFGRVLVEAMACQVAVVGSSSGEIPNVIGDAGLVYPEDNVDALRTCLADLIDNTGRRLDLGRRGRERVLSRYTQEQIASATYAVWREMLQNRLAHPGSTTADV